MVPDKHIMSDEHTLQADDEKDSPPKRLWYDATITHLSQLTPAVTGVTIDVDVDRPMLTGDQGASWQPVDPSKPFAFLPGQWVDFYIPAINKVGGYSITSLPSHLPQLELAVKRSRHPPADWTTSKAQVGDAVKVRVGGEFVYSTPSGSEEEQIVDGGDCKVPAPDSKGLLFIAGGVGINPLYGMLRQLHSDALATKVESATCTQGPKATLLYSASKADELLFEPELTDMAREFPNNFQMAYHVTKDEVKGSGEDSSSNHRRGRITSGEISEALQWATGATTDESAASSSGDGKAMLVHVSSVYICGPTGFAEEMSEACQEHGVPRSAIHFEQWW
mmetsp:Transcript_33971/g.100112  ORF Transcript_33971/g.100112 Transcript_33971/m.100112 type:complete len:335 (-) Transcript_33971:1046-2050(-)